MGEKIGEFLGIDVYSDPNVPNGVIYLLNDELDYTHTNCDCQVILVGRWQRLKYKLRKIFKKLIPHKKAK